MAIDSHMHMGSQAVASARLTSLLASRVDPTELRRLLSVSGTLEEIDLAGIDRAFVLPMTFEEQEIPAANDFIVESCRQHPRTFIGVCAVPVHDRRAARAEVDRMVEAGMFGLKLHPSLQKFDPADHAMYPIYEHAQAVRMPILMHSGVSTPYASDRLCRPMAIDDVLCEFPGLVVILAHGGRLWHDEAAMILRKHVNAYIDISANVGRDGSSFVMARLLRVVKAWTGGVDRVLFGSDYPFYMPSLTRQLLEACVDTEQRVTGSSITASDVEEILSNGDELVSRLSDRNGGTDAT